MGTGITTGPYAITSGQVLALNDPATWSIASETVQIQNNTGFTVFVQSAGAGYNIQPFTVSTIPCAGGQTLVAVVSSTANVAVGFLTPVWLLPGQTGPMPDGPMTIYPKSTTLLTVTYSGSPQDASLSGWKPTDTSITIFYQGGNFTAPYNYWWLLGGGTNKYSAFANNGTSTATFSGMNLAVVSSFLIWYGTSTTETNIAHLTSQFTSMSAVSSN